MAEGDTKEEGLTGGRLGASNRPLCASLSSYPHVARKRSPRVVPAFPALCVPALAVRLEKREGVSRSRSHALMGGYDNSNNRDDERNNRDDHGTESMSTREFLAFGTPILAERVRRGYRVEPALPRDQEEAISSLRPDHLTDDSNEAAKEFPRSGSHSRLDAPIGLKSPVRG